MTSDSLLNLSEDWDNGGGGTFLERPLYSGPAQPAPSLCVQAPCRSGSWRENCSVCTSLNWELRMSFAARGCFFGSHSEGGRIRE